LYFLALATDYDGTIAEEGVVSAETCAALQAFKQTGRRLIMVTGRELPDLKRVFGELQLFDLVVAENGALLYNPASEEERVIAPPPSEKFIARLEAKNVAPLSVGRSIVATWEPHQNEVLEAIHELGLELQIIFNKGAVMVLPAGVNKATGLAAALEELQLSAHNVVGVGDAENDHAFMRACGCSAAVANALPMVKDTADIRLPAPRGAGVVQLIDMIARKDARIVPPARHGISIGTDRAGEEVYIEPYRGSVLIAGSSGIGKSTLAAALTERMAERKFEFCVFDPEGDYDTLENAVPVGDATTVPQLSEIEKLLSKGVNVTVNTQALEVEERPPFFAKLLPMIASRRAKTGRPHWLLIDEAHHLLPAARGDIAAYLPKEIPAGIFITVHPEAVAREALKTVDRVIALGEKAPSVIGAYCNAIGLPVPDVPVPATRDEFLIWTSDGDLPPYPVKAKLPRQQRKRHTRKYADGDLGADRSFYFRGTDGALNLRAQNLTVFLQMAEGVDDRTWTHHLQAGDYSRWFRDMIKDDDLAQEARVVESDESLDPKQSRQRIREAVTRRYTAPASSAAD
jgi:hydroxymethylpyrimidine pyrophosphatase-like HAD family hydrolase